MRNILAAAKQCTATQHVLASVQQFNYKGTIEISLILVAHIMLMPAYCKCNWLQATMSSDDEDMTSVLQECRRFRCKGAAMVACKPWKPWLSQ